MKILILGLNYAPEPVGIAVYTTGLAEALAAMGHDVRVVAGKPYYPGWKIMAGHDPLTIRCSTENGVDVTRVPHYIPRHPTGPRRLLHHLSFSVTAALPMLAQAALWRPRTVLAIAPSLIAAPIASAAAALCGARSWLHVQDLELEAARATGLLPPSTATRLAEAFERFVLTRFDAVSAISAPMCRKLAQKGVPADRISEHRNWSDLDAIRPLAHPSPFRAKWSITTPHVALYSGSLARKQGIEIVIEAARALRNRDDLTVLVCGEGPDRARLEALAADLPNLRFRDLQPPERLADLLGLATVHLLPQIAGAADLMLPSKLANMLASGRPVVATAAPGTGLFDEVAGCGAATPPGDANAFATAITATIDSADYAALCAAARRRAEQRWNATTILPVFAAALMAPAPVLVPRPAP